MNPSNKKPNAPNVKLPVAPPVYRPQPMPKVLQRKLVAGVNPSSVQAPRLPIAPPVYRPQATPLVQRKSVSPVLKSPALPVPQPKTFGFSPAVIQRAEKKKSKKEEKKERREARLTRIIRLDQLSRSNIGVNSTRKSERSLKRNLPLKFKAKGKHTTRVKGLYTYMRRYGGAGIQGVHRGGAATPRAEVVHSVLSKMAQDPNRRTSRRPPKFAIIGIDPSRLNANQLLDTTTDQMRDQFAQQYGGPGSGSGKNYMKMFNRHRSEGVVGLVGTIPLDAIMGLRAVRGVPDVEDLEEILEELVASDSEEEDVDLDPFCDDGSNSNFGSGWPPPDGGMGGGMGGGDGITA